MNYLNTKKVKYNWFLGILYQDDLYIVKENKYNIFFLLIYDFIHRIRSK